MSHKKVKSVEQLKELLDQEKHDFFVSGGIWRSSKYIRNLDDESGIHVTHYIDEREEKIKWEDVPASYIGLMISQGLLYAEFDD